MTGLGRFVQQRVTLYNSTVLRGCVTVSLLCPPPQLRVGLHLHVENVLGHLDVAGGGLVLLPVVAGGGHVPLPAVVAGGGHVLLSALAGGGHVRLPALAGG